jgi:hypothetical protein
MKKITLKEALDKAASDLKSGKSSKWMIFEGYVEWCDSCDYTSYADKLGLSFVAMTDFGHGREACLAVCINEKNYGGAYPPVVIPGGSLSTTLMSYSRLNALKGLFLTDGCGSIDGNIYSYTWDSPKPWGGRKRLKYRIKKIPTKWDYRRIIKLYIHHNLNIIECYKAFDIIEDCNE